MFPKITPFLSALIYLTVILTSLPANLCESQILEDKCSKIQTVVPVQGFQIYIGTYEDARECLLQYRFPYKDFETTIDFLVDRFIQFYAYRYLVSDSLNNDANTSEIFLKPFKVHNMTVNLEQELLGLKQKWQSESLKSEDTSIEGIPAHSDIMRIFNKLGDAHTQYTIDMGKQEMLRGRSYAITVALDPAGKQRVFFKRSNFVTLSDQVFNKNDAVLFEDYYNLPIKTINGIDALTYILENDAASENFGLYKSAGTRLNRMLELEFFFQRPLFQNYVPFVNDESLTEVIGFDNGENITASFFAYSFDSVSLAGMEDKLQRTDSFLKVREVGNQIFNNPFWAERTNLDNTTFGESVLARRETEENGKPLDKSEKKEKSDVNFEDFENLNEKLKELELDLSVVSDTNPTLIEDDDTLEACDFQLFDPSRSDYGGRTYCDGLSCTLTMEDVWESPIFNLKEVIEKGALYAVRDFFDIPNPIGYCYVVDDAVVFKLKTFMISETQQLFDFWNGTVSTAQSRGIKKIIFDPERNLGGLVSMPAILQRLFNPSLPTTIDGLCQPFDFLHTPVFDVFDRFYSKTLTEWEEEIEKWPSTQEEFAILADALLNLIPWIGAIYEDSFWYATLQTLSDFMQENVVDMSEENTEINLKLWREAAGEALAAHLKRYSAELFLTGVPCEDLKDSTDFPGWGEIMALYVTPVSNYGYDEELSKFSYNCSDGTAYHQNGKNRFYGGVDRQYGKAGAIFDCFGVAAQQEFWDFNPYIPYEFDEINILTNGVCGSACSQFVSHLQVSNPKVVTVGYGGIQGEDFDSSGFAGGTVRDWEDVWRGTSVDRLVGLLFHQAGEASIQEEVEENISHLPLPLPRADVTINYNFMRLKELGPDSLPREFYIIPPQVRIDYWGSVDKKLYQDTLTKAAEFRNNTVIYREK